MNRSIRYSIVTAVGSKPWLFELYYRNHPRYSRLVVRRDSEIVIEGFPRCANSFSVLAFQAAQGRSVRIAHHLHAAAQIVLGVQYRIPVLVLVREPLAAVASLLTRHPEIGAGQALRQYCSFYAAARRLQSSIVMADFRSVTDRYAVVIEEVNRRFRTGFAPYVNGTCEDAAVFAEIDRLNSSTEAGDLRMLARPSDAKTESLASARALVTQHPMLAVAQEIHHAICQHTV